MAHYNATVSAPRPADQVFAFLADFRTVVEWDPSMRSAELVAGQPAAVGGRYRLTIDTPGSETVIDYETVELDAPRRFVLRGETDALLSVDTVTVTTTGPSSCDVTYDADLELKGIRKLADPLVDLGLTRASDKARDGLHERLRRLPDA